MPEKLINRNLICLGKVDENLNMTNAGNLVEVLVNKVLGHGKDNNLERRMARISLFLELSALSRGVWENGFVFTGNNKASNNPSVCTTILG